MSLRVATGLAADLLSDESAAGHTLFVMAGLEPVIYAASIGTRSVRARSVGEDGRIKPGHDGNFFANPTESQKSLTVQITGVSASVHSAPYSMISIAVQFVTQQD
jgi:hypothetical protein